MTVVAAKRALVGRSSSVATANPYGKPAFANASDSHYIAVTGQPTRPYPMIVCICHRVSDRDIQRAVRAGCEDFAELQRELRVGTACGACTGCAKEALARACTQLGSDALAAAVLSCQPAHRTAHAAA